MRWQFKKFYKGDKSLEDEKRSSRPLEVGNDQYRAIIEADPLTNTEKLAEELSINCSMVIWHLKQIGKVKKLDKWASHELTDNQKNHFEVQSSLILCNNNRSFLNQIATCAEKWNLYNNQQQPSQWLDLEEAPKHFPK